MNRLTIMTPDGAALDMDYTYQSEDEARGALMIKFRVAVERLAAYEDTGLMPEEIDSEYIHEVLEENKRLEAELDSVQREKNTPLTFATGGGYKC